MNKIDPLIPYSQYLAEVNNLKNRIYHLNEELSKPFKLRTQPPPIILSKDESVSILSTENTQLKKRIEELEAKVAKVELHWALCQPTEDAVQQYRDDNKKALLAITTLQAKLDLAVEGLKEADNLLQMLECWDDSKKIQQTLKEIKGE